MSINKALFLSLKSIRHSLFSGYRFEESDESRDRGAALFTARTMVPAPLPAQDFTLQYFNRGYIST